MSAAHPYVSGKRVVLASHSQSRGGPTTLGVFSSHWAAVAALIRLRQPEFKSLDGDKQEDLDKEPAMRAALAKATGVAPATTTSVVLPPAVQAEAAAVGAAFDGTSLEQGDAS